MASPDQSLSQPEDDNSKTAKDNSSRLLNFFVDEAPACGDVTKIMDGVYWLRMSLPMKGLDHINLWFLRDGDSWVVIDTGIGSRDSKEIWENVFENHMGGRGVNRVIVTHLHPDHSGLAGWITRKFDAPLLMTRGEYFLCRLMAADTGQPAPREGIKFFERAGFTDDQIEVYKSRFGGFGKAITPMPHGYERLEDGDSITIDGREWKIVVGSGHSPEHACLWCPELKICMTGDQLLPNISSNVSVWPTESEGNPMQDWIDSCHKLRNVLDEDTLICPAHGIPFTGAHRRLDKLIYHHERALDRLYDLCKTPKLSTEVYSALFRTRITDSNRLMAVGESIAHLNCLVARGQMTRRINDAGQYTYKSKPPQ
ncbi:MAG: MBL fold metallo-hydrolase [Robiginitomaculum sp.]|nr:MAG: MBL fold metallo-hydrolase [Robiginitomaculum sp.]